MKKFAIATLLIASTSVQAVEVGADVETAAKDGAVRVIVTFKDKVNRGKLKKKSSKQEVKRSLKANFTASSKNVKKSVWSVQQGWRWWRYHW